MILTSDNQLWRVSSTQSEVTHYKRLKRRYLKEDVREDLSSITVQNGPEDPLNLAFDVTLKGHTIIPKGCNVVRKGRTVVFMSAGDMNDTDTDTVVLL